MSPVLTSRFGRGCPQAPPSAQARFVDREAAYGHCEEVGLIRCEPGKIANPSPAHTETEQNEWENAAGRGGDSSDEASGCH
jgi:hypothetical protein